MLEQAFYSLVHGNAHFQNLHAELERLKVFLAQHDVHPADVVDVGCGDGAVTLSLRAILAAPEIWGVDLNKTLLARAARRGVRTVCQDMASLALERRFDLVVSYGSLHHVPDSGRFVQGLARLSSRHVLIVDNTVRNTGWHRLTGSRHFPFELSPYPVRPLEEILAGLRGAGCAIVGVLTARNANLWHDRSFVLAVVDAALPARMAPGYATPASACTAH